MPEMPPDLRRRFIATRLRRLRDEAGLTIEDVARLLMSDKSKISRMENAKNRLHPRDVIALLGAYRVSDDERDFLLQLLEQSNRRTGWWHKYADAISPEYADLISLEADAREIQVFHCQVVPGLLQTRDYASHIISANTLRSPNTPVDEVIKARMARQQIIAKGQAALKVVLTEAVLRQEVGGADVLKGQLAELLELSRQPNVTLRVLPFKNGVHGAKTGSFTVVTLDPGFPVVYVELLHGVVYVEEEEEIEAYQQTFRQLSHEALSETESREFLGEVIKSF